MGVSESGKIFPIESDDLQDDFRAKAMRKRAGRDEVEYGAKCHRHKGGDGDEDEESEERYAEFFQHAL